MKSKNEYLNEILYTPLAILRECQMKESFLHCTHSVDFNDCECATYPDSEPEFCVEHGEVA